MKAWLVDTNGIFDVLGADETFGERSAWTLADCTEVGILVVKPVILAEVSALLELLEELEQLVPTSLFRWDELPLEASFLAGQAYAHYKRRGGQNRECWQTFSSVPMLSRRDLGSSAVMRVMTRCSRSSLSTHRKADC